jgi:hypothetical protein
MIMIMITDYFLFNDLMYYALLSVYPMKTQINIKMVMKRYALLSLAPYQMR